MIGRREEEKGKDRTLRVREKKRGKGREKRGQKGRKGKKGETVSL